MNKSFNYWRLPHVVRSFWHRMRGVKIQRESRNLKTKTLQERLFAVADWVERVDANPKFRRAVYYFLALVVCFFAGVFSHMIWG